MQFATMTISDIMCVEKYRPKKISEMVNQTDIKGSLTALLKNKEEIPHLLFSGSAGVGKTTMALCISQEILGDKWKDYTLELNASDERGINKVRERVKKFSRFAGLDSQIPFKIIILDEADEMTSDAQTALRRIIEDTAKFCRFILIANNISKIIDPIQSRCAVFKFTRIDENEIIEQLKIISKKEKLKVDEKGLKQVTDQGEIEKVRARHISQGTLDILLERGWIELKGRRKTPGKPLTWGTTDKFLEHFNLADLKELPSIKEINQLGISEKKSG